MENITENWEEIKLYIKEEHDLTDVSFNTWIEPLKVDFVDEDTNTVFISIPANQSQYKNYLMKKYHLLIKVAISEFTNKDYDVELILEDDKEARELNEKKDLLNNPNYEKANINHKFTFDNFVVGSNNRFAYSAAVAVAEAPGENYNPLFIYGGVGLGKTHLMHAIANYIITENKDAKVLYVTSETFTNELIESIRNGKNTPTAMRNFREKYRNVDVLLIDDIQFIIGKDSTQEEFFNTFNQLHEEKKQIVISSDKPPKEMEVLEERYKSRFVMGLIADIQQPDYETRMAILKKKKEQLNYNDKESITDEVITYIANNVTSNIRELEGALNKLIQFSRLGNKQISLELAEEALKDIISPMEAVKITPEYILDIVCDHYNVSPDDVCSKKRNQEIVLPRQVIMYLCRKYTDAAQKKIALLCGKTDHTTVIHAENKIKSELEINKELQSSIETIVKKINP